MKRNTGGMRRSGPGSGGGLGNRKVTHYAAPKAEPRAQGIRPGHAAQIGASLGNKAMESGTKRLDPAVKPKIPGYNPVGPTDNVRAVGVGGGRTIHHCGTQSQHGPAAGTNKAQGRDILSDFGSEIKR